MCYHFCITLLDVSDVSIVGLGITYAISLSGLFQYVVRQSAEVENVVSCMHLVVVSVIANPYVTVSEKRDLVAQNKFLMLWVVDSILCYVVLRIQGYNLECAEGQADQLTQAIVKNKQIFIEVPLPV